MRERDRQDEKWGPQFHNPAEWLTVIMEELGEASQEALKMRFGNQSKRCEYYRKMREELVQVAAVVVAAIESLDSQ